MNYGINGSDRLQRSDPVIRDSFLFADNCLRITPPLSITEAEIKKACGVVAKACDY